MGEGGEEGKRRVRREKGEGGGKREREGKGKMKEEAIFITAMHKLVASYRDF